MPAAPQPSAAPPSPEPTPQSAEPTPSSPVHLDIGWVRDADDPSAPVLQLTTLVHHGASAKSHVARLLADVGPLLACATSAISEAQPRASFQIRLRRADAPDDDPLRIDVQPTEATSLARCLDEAVRPKLETVATGDVAVLSFRVFVDRDESFLREADDDRVVSVREAGTCWQWPTYPCAPHKMCRAAEFVRTTCGEPTMRDDVSLSFSLGPADARGHAAPVELRLLGGDGQTLWTTALPEATQQRYGPRFAVADAPIVLRPGGNVLDTSMGIEHVLVADTAGLHVYARRTGELLGEWLAPPRQEPTMQFDGGQVVVRRRRATCSGDAGHGSFFVSCDDRFVWFDGHTLAVFAGADPRPRATKALGNAGAKLRGETLTPALSVSAGGVSVEVKGQIFVQ